MAPRLATKQRLQVLESILLYGLVHLPVDNAASPIDWPGSSILEQDRRMSYQYVTLSFHETVRAPLFLHPLRLFSLPSTSRRAEI